MIVTRQRNPNENHSHNHIPDFAHHIKKDINEELRNLAVNNVNRKTTDIVDTVLQENKDFKTFFESNSSMPNRKSMMRTIQRARKNLKPPTVSNLDINFVVEKKH